MKLSPFVKCEIVLFAATFESIMSNVTPLVIRLLLETKYRRLPVVDGDGKLVFFSFFYFHINDLLDLDATLSTWHLISFPLM